MDYGKALEELSAKASDYHIKKVSFKDYVDCAKDLVPRLQFTPMLVEAPKRSKKILRKDRKARSILGKTYSEFGVVPIETRGDGNCLYNAVSIALIGDESLAQELRLRTCLEMLIHFDYYNETYKNSKFNICTEELDNECKRVCRDKTFSSVWAVVALASVIRVGIRSVYPEIDDEYNKQIYPVLNNLFLPRKGLQGGGVIVMWTRVMPPNPVWSPDHFVAMLPKKNTEGGKFYRAKCLPLLMNTTSRFDNMKLVEGNEEENETSQPTPLFTNSLPIPFNYLGAGVAAIWNKVKDYMISVYLQVYRFFCMETAPPVPNLSTPHQQVPMNMIERGEDRRLLIAA